MYPLDFPHVLHRGEIHQNRINKFSHKPRRPEAENIRVWHHAKEKNGRERWERLQEQKFEDPQTSKTHENARKEAIEVEER